MADTTNYFDINLYRIAVDIYSYAERVVLYPNDQDGIDYAHSRAAIAISMCRANKINWLPISKECKGKKLAGRITVSVEMNSDTRYGFSHYKPNANRISEILRAMFLKEIHGEGVEEILKLEGE